jgi:hypothetical protein
MEMTYTAPLDDLNWMGIVDYYFDHVHWVGEDRNTKYDSPADWVWDQYGAAVDMQRRVYIFGDEQKRNWFVMKWL